MSLIQAISFPPPTPIPTASGRSEAFLAASREGDFEALLTILDERVVLRADDAAVRAGALREVRRRAGSRRPVLGTCPGGAFRAR